MEVIKNQTNEEQQEPQQMSEFCEKLMDATDGLIPIIQPTDSALLICTDGIKLAARKCGNRQAVMNALYSLMKSDDEFAEVIMSACMQYSHDMLGRRVGEKIDSLN